MSWWVTVVGIATGVLMLIPFFYVIGKKNEKFESELVENKNISNLVLISKFDEFNTKVGNFISTQNEEFESLDKNDSSKYKELLNKNKDIRDSLIEELNKNNELKSIETNISLTGIIDDSFLETPFKASKNYDNNIKNLEVWKEEYTSIINSKKWKTKKVNVTKRGKEK